MGSKTKHWLILVVLILGSLWLTGEVTAVAADPLNHENENVVLVEEGIDPANCRYGVSGSPGNYDWITTLRSGWYVNFVSRFDPPPSNGAQYLPMLRYRDGAWIPALTPAGLGAQLAARPGQLWIAGSEVETPFEGTGAYLQPHEYAAAYKEVYDYIKLNDPTARVAIAGLSMMTPGRIEYLTKVWDAYQTNYGVEMPVDVWTMHLYILAERLYNSDENGHGQIALGTDYNLAKQHPPGSPPPRDGDISFCPQDDVYCVTEHDDVTIFEDQIVALRTWMKDRGQQNKPLLLTEYSILYQPTVEDEAGNFFTDTRVINYLNATMDWLDGPAGQDANLGYPDDNNRLVQQWLWFSLYAEPGDSGATSNLLKENYISYGLGSEDALTAIGDAYLAKVNEQTSYVDFKALTAASVSELTDPSTNTATVSLPVTFLNNGNQNQEDPFEVTFYADAGLTQPFDSVIVSPSILGCAFNTYSVSGEWAGLAPGTYPYWAKVDGLETVSEEDETDNVVTGTVTVTQNAIPFLSGQPQAANVLLNWTVVDAAVSYNLYRGDSPYFAPTTPYQTALNTNSFPDPGVLAAPGAHYYVVTSVDSGGSESGFSNRFGVFTFGITGGAAPLGTPQIAIDVDGDDALVTWPSAANATGYVIYTASLPYQPVSAPGESVAGLEFRDDGVIGLIPPVYYQATATDNTNESAASNEVGKFSFGITAGSN